MSNVIVGSGISGLIAGLLLSKKGKKVIIVEKDQHVGGLLKSFNYGDFGFFDYGMHNFLETGIPEIDQSILNLFPLEDWNILEGKKRDIAGAYFNGKIQFNSPYIDIRHFDAKYLSNLWKHFEQSEINEHEPAKNAEEYIKERFGSELSELTTHIALKKIFQTSPKNLDVAAIHLTPLSRLVISDEDQTLQSYRSEFLRERIAFPEQRNLPLELSSGRRGFYPKQFGIFRVAHALEKEIISNGGTILTSSSIKNISISQNKIDKITIDNKGGIKEIEDVNSLIWTANIFSLGNVLDYSFKGYKYDQPLKTYVINLLVDTKPKLGDLYYFFCYEQGFKTFRLTNYSAYCSNAIRDGLYPLSLELLIDPSEDMSLTEIKKTAFKELKHFNILEENTSIKFSRAEKLSSGIPMLTINNTISLKSVRNRIKKDQINNLIIAGVSPDENIFFQTEVLKDIYNKTLKL